MWLFLITCVAGFFYAQISEWFIHRYFLHALGTKKNSPFSFHFLEHHRVCRKLEFRDPIYENPLFSEKGDTHEVVYLGLLALGHIPLFFVAPGFVTGAIIGATRYYYVHRRCHLEPEWCKKHFPWHYDHHMAPNQHMNWGVTNQWVDKILGTREYYLGTERAERDEQKRRERAMAQAK